MLDIVAPHHVMHMMHSCVTFDLCLRQVFSDLPPSMVFTDPNVVGIRQALGDGGFGTVYLGTLSMKVGL